METMDCPASGQDKHDIGSRARECDKCLEYLNALRLFHRVHYEPDGSLDKELNQRMAADRVHKFVHEMSLQEHFMYMKRFEAATAEVAFLYHQKIVKERIADPAGLERKSSNQEFQKAVELQKLAQRPKKERVQLDSRDKAIRALMAVGVSEKDARESVDKPLREQGKVVA